LLENLGNVEACSVEEAKMLSVRDWRIDVWACKADHTVHKQRCSPRIFAANPQLLLC